jgi:hypothetical protein
VVDSFPGRFSIGDEVAVPARLRVANRRVEITVRGVVVGAWPIDDLEIARDGERFHFRTPEESFEFVTVWDDDLHTALNPPSPLTAELIHRTEPER